MFHSVPNQRDTEERGGKDLTAGSDVPGLTESCCSVKSVVPTLSDG